MAAEISPAAQRIVTGITGLKRKVAMLEAERLETAEAWEQLATTFPAIQADAMNQIEAAQFINGRMEDALHKLTGERIKVARIKELLGARLNAAEIKDHDCNLAAALRSILHEIE